MKRWRKYQNSGQPSQSGVRPTQLYMGEEGVCGSKPGEGRPKEKGLTFSVFLSSFSLGRHK